MAKSPVYVSVTIVIRPHVKEVYLSKVSGPILKKFHLKHHQVGGKAALGFCADWI